MPGRGATLIHLTPGRYSRSEYSSLTSLIANAVELVSEIESAAANSMLSLFNATYTRRSIPPVEITAVLDVFCVNV